MKTVNWSLLTCSLHDLLFQSCLQSRTIATSQSSFNWTMYPLLIACLASPIRIIFWWTPTQGTNSTELTSGTLQDGSKNLLFESLFQQLLFFQVLRASGAKNVACKISKRQESQNQCCTVQWAGKYLCETLSYGLFLRIIVLAKKCCKAILLCLLHSKTFQEGHACTHPP